MKFSVEDLFSKCEEIRSFLRIYSHLLMRSLMENFRFCAMHFFWTFGLSLYYENLELCIWDCRGSLRKVTYGTKCLLYITRQLEGVLSKSCSISMKKCFFEWSCRFTSELLLYADSWGLCSWDFWQIIECFRSSHPEVFLGKGLWKYAANLQENTHAKMWFQ